MISYNGFFSMLMVRLVWTMDGLRINNGAPHTLWTFNSIEDLRKYKRGCDQENGGYSTVHLDLEESPEVNAPIERQATGKFWGEMRLDVKPSSRLSRGGFAMFRNKVCMYSPAFHLYFLLKQTCCRTDPLYLERSQTLESTMNI